jgi:hypothetical protein
MKLAPKARRFIDEAAAGLAPADRERLRAWLRANPDSEAPQVIISLCVRALQGYEAQMLDRLEKVRGDDDAESEIINDVRFVQAAVRSLQSHGTPTPACAR